MTLQYDNLDKMFYILITEINKQTEENDKGDNSIYGRHPTPQPNNREIIEAYNDLKYSRGDICIIKLSRSYCIYMVYHLGKYWMVPYSTEGYNFQIEEYVDEDEDDYNNDIFLQEQDEYIEKIEKGENIYIYERDIDFDIYDDNVSENTISSCRAKKMFFNVYTRLKNLFI
jgi:hypothetical protein